MLTKLDAVNQILDAIGEDPVSSLKSGLPDAEKAERFLDRVSKEIQAKGWHCNTDDSYTFAPDVNGKIKIPSTVLRVDTTGRDASLDVTARFSGSSRYLYNKKDSTFVFTGSIRCRVVWLFDFAELTPELQMYIAAHTARRYQESEMGSAALDAFVKRAEQEAWAALQDSEADTEDLNVLTDSAHCRMITQRNNPFFGT